MTTDITTPTNGRGDTAALLEQILEKVETIEETVDLILDRLTEYVDHASQGDPWNDPDHIDDMFD